MFILRHKPTGKIFPQHLRFGQTYLEFVHNKAPRLFASRQSASCFLTVWCAGPLERTYTRDEWGSPDRERLTHISAPHRIRSEYEIVPVTLTYGSPF